MIGIREKAKRLEPSWGIKGNHGKEKVDGKYLRGGRSQAPQNGAVLDSIFEKDTYPRTYAQPAQDQRHDANNGQKVRHALSEALKLAQLGRVEALLPGDTPLLISRPALKALGGVLDLRTNEIEAITKALEVITGQVQGYATKHLASISTRGTTNAFEVDQEERFG